MHGVCRAGQPQFGYVHCQDCVQNALRELVAGRGGSPAGR